MLTMYRRCLLLSTIFFSMVVAPTPSEEFSSTVDFINRWGASTVKNTLVKHDVTIHGASTVKDSKINGNVTLNGASTIKNSPVNGHTKIRGATSFKETVLNTLDLSGAGDFIKTTVNGIVDIYGAVTARYSNFKNTFSITGALTAWNSHFTQIFLSATKTKLNNCTVQTIEINTQANSWKLEIFGLCLYEKKYESYLILNDCIVEGDIIFNGPAGTVVVDTKTVIKGNVVNGTVVCK